VSEPPDFDCSAYGPGGRDIGALCFFAVDERRICPDAATCAARMDAERQFVFDRMTKLAAEGDEMWRWLATQFTSPDELLKPDDAQ